MARITRTKDDRKMEGPAKPSEAAAKKNGNGNGDVIEISQFKTTEEIQVPKKTIDQIIGQEKAVEIVRKAAAQRRNVLLLGSPGTGKSMLAQGMAELLPAETLEDALAYPNEFDENNPKIRVLPTYPKGLPPEGANEEAMMGQGRQILFNEKMRRRLPAKSGKSPLLIVLAILIIGLLVFQFVGLEELEKHSTIIAAVVLGGLFVVAMWMFTSRLQSSMGRRDDLTEPKLIVDNTGKRNAPFVEATGAKAGALFGDVRHDPLQCIPKGECVIDENGNVIPVEKVVNRYFESDEEGEKEILNSDEYLLGGFDGAFRLLPTKVVRVYKRQYNGDLIQITTRSGSKIRVTPNHPVAVFDESGKIVYSDAGELKLNDYAIIPEKISTKTLSRVDCRDLNLLADIITDGHVAQRNVQFKLKQFFKIETILADIESAGLKASTRVRKDKNGVTRIDINSAVFVRKLKEIGLSVGKEKLIPPVLFECSDQDIRAFISRLLSIDGYINPQGQFEIISKNRQFIQQLRSLCFKLGFNAKYKPRLDTGFAKGKLQHRLRWNNYDFAKVYSTFTVNPIHKQHTNTYLSNTSFNKEAFEDVVPLDFSVLERMRIQLSVSKEKIHSDYWAINPSVSNSKKLTKAMLNRVSNRILSIDQVNLSAMNLRNMANGDYSFDQIVSIERIPYEGFVYNFTTETGNYIVDHLLTHNSGGLGTPPHLRVEAGAIHRANHGVLYVDEVGTLGAKSQQDLLGAMQERKFPITGQSEMSSGALTRTEPVPCDFVLVAAGNVHDLQQMHPALRSRIRGYGYEIYLNDTMPDTPENREKIIRFVAQEVKKDGKIPHFARDAVIAIIREARRKAGRKHRLTLKLRELGGLIRAAGDIAKSESAKNVEAIHILKAKGVAQTIEQQLSHQLIEQKKEYSVLETEGYGIGRVNGLAVLGDGSSGLVMPIVAEVTPASSKFEGKVIATGKLGEIAKEAVDNVSAIIKKHMKKDVTSFDVHIQFLQTYEGVEGDSASISVALAVLSAMESLQVRQDVAMTGSLSVRGEVLPVGGVTAKVEAAIDAGMTTVIVPKENEEDIVLSSDMQKRIRIIPVGSIIEVILAATKDSPQKERLMRELKKELK